MGNLHLTFPPNPTYACENLSLPLSLSPSLPLSLSPSLSLSLSPQGIRAFLESNGNPSKAQRALAKERSHMGDEEVTWGDDNVSLQAADKHPKEDGIRNLLKGMSGSSDW